MYTFFVVYKFNIFKNLNYYVLYVYKIVFLIIHKAQKFNMMNR